MRVLVERVAAAMILAATVMTGSALGLVEEHAYETNEMRKPMLQTGGSCIIRNVTIHSAIAPAVVGDVLVVEGKITAVGDVGSQEGLVEIDGSGQHLAPGVVDSHSHMAIERGINEGTVSITAEVDISDSINPEDLTIYRALAGGVTTARLLHGSANPIGGKHEVIKLKWGRTADELRFPGAPEGIKFALGENPKQSNWGDRGTRFPGSRMGTEAIYSRAFERALEYKSEWQVFKVAVAAGEDPLPPRRDLRLDALVGVLDGDMVVHCHCYRADGVLMIMRVAQRFGFRLGALQHVLEGYKVAKEMADAGVPGSTFGDWWSYKVEAYDAIPQNAALMDEAGVLSSLNSDSEEMMRRLYGEAAKSVRYAGLDPVRALALVTINPAKQLGVDARVGSIEIGKDADLTLLNGHPLSSLSRVVWTMVDGEVEFQRIDSFGFDADPLVAEPLETSAVVPMGWNPAGGPVTALAGGTIHTVTGPEIENGSIVFQDGLILDVGIGISIPASARVVDVSGKHVWPGMIALNTPLGMREISSVRSTVDTGEIGGNQPDLRTLASINAESAHIPVTRANGITRAQVSPQSGGPIMGQSSVIDLTGDNWEELAFADRDMLHIRFPRISNRAEKKEAPDAVEEMKRLFAAAREHMRLLDEAERGVSSPPPFDSRLAALGPFLRGEQRVALHASNAQTILLALEFAKDEELDVVLFGVGEGWKVAERIASAGVPVVVGPVLSMPGSQFDPYDAAFSNAAVLVRAGVSVALQSGDQENPRNLAFHAAMAAAYGLPRAEALRAITLYPARILGMDDKLGSLEPGKIADLIVTDGDLLEITSRTDYVFIDGEQSELDNRQTQFYEKYRARLLRLQSAGGR